MLCKWTTAVVGEAVGVAPLQQQKMLPIMLFLRFDNANFCYVLALENEDSKRLRKSFRNFILSQVNINRYVNHMSRSIRMNGHRNKQRLYIRQRYVPEYSQSTTKVGYSSSKFQQDLALI